MFVLTAETQKILGSVPSIIDKTCPIPGRFRRTVPSNVAELSRLLTAGRGDRSLSYLNRPNFLSAYLHYFLPWNLYRLCFLLPSLDLRLSPSDIIVDIGSGPLTFVLALWISRPDLRSKPLEFHCIDRSAPALEAGKEIFSGLCRIPGNAGNPWKIKLIKKEIDVRPGAAGARSKQTVKTGYASLVCAINVYNEIYENLPHRYNEGLKRMAANIAYFMKEYSTPDGSILTVEPGVPQSGRFISLLRSAFMELNHFPVSPCPHTAPCPMSGSNKRWCHFAFEAPLVPKELKRISSAAKLPKDRLVLSYLLTAGAKKPDEGGMARVISDAFPLPGGSYGRYCCSAGGLVLLTGKKKRIEKINNGNPGAKR